MKPKSREDCGSIIIDRKRNELAVSLMKKKRARTRNAVSVVRSFNPDQDCVNSCNFNDSRVQRCDLDSGFCFRRALLQNYSNFKSSSAPSRFMSFKRDSWVDFSEEVFGSLKAGFVVGMPAVEVSVDGSPFLFDFFRMLQIDFETANPRSIAWIDVDGRCFFPKVIVDGGIDAPCEEPNYPKLEIDIKIDGGVLDSLDKSHGGKPDAPDSVEECTDESTSHNQPLPGSGELKIPANHLERPRWPDVQILKDADRDYQIVKYLFLAGMKSSASDATVTSISRCLHKSPLQNARLRAFHSQMEITKTTRGDANVKFAWHGISAQGVASILTHGFGQPNGFPNSEAHGVGLYLSPQNSSHSSALFATADEKGERHVILCRVIAGSVEKVAVGSQQVHPSTEDFDIAADDPVNPRWYIVWNTHMNRHILPEYIVSYKCKWSNNPQGLVRKAPATTTSLSFQKLFSEMKNSLPSSKLQALNYEYGQYKAGKMTKDVLIRKIRLIAGDGLVVATIQRIRGH
ncbi:hypothetical protein ACLOJK_036114 [Asimina triloba]